MDAIADQLRDACDPSRDARNFHRHGLPEHAGNTFGEVGEYEDVRVAVKLVKLVLVEEAMELHVGLDASAGDRGFEPLAVRAAADYVQKNVPAGGDYAMNGLNEYVAALLRERSARAASG